MSFAGHVFDAVNRMRANEALKKSLRRKFKKKVRYLYSDYHNRFLQDNLFREPTKEELEKIRSQVKEQISIQKRNNVRAFFITIFILLIIFLTVFFGRK